MTRRDRGTLAQALAFASTAIGSVIVLGIHGFVVMEKANPFLRNLAVAQWLLVMAGLLWIGAIDLFLFEKAPSVAPIRWGRMPARSQYALVLLCVVVVLLMGLMGFVRSGLREDWHVYGLLRDTSDSAWTPTNAYMARVVGGIVLAFLGLLAFVFWLAGLGGYASEATSAEKRVGDAPAGGPPG